MIPTRLVRRFFFSALAMFCVVGTALALDPKPAANEPATSANTITAKVEIPNAGKPETVTAVLGFQTLVLQTSFGEVVLDLSKVKQIGIDLVESGSVRARAELLDGQQFHGTLVPKPLTITVDGTPRTLALEEGLKIRVIHTHTTGIWAAILGLIALTLMEIVLGIDNIIFLAIVAGKLPEAEQPRARRIGLVAALVTRLMLLFSITWLMVLTKPIFTLPEMPFFQDVEARGISWRDLILLVGGAFLIGKSVLEMHEKAEHHEEKPGQPPAKKSRFVAVIFQIALIDILFSLDSVITAVGMVEELWVMIVAMVTAVGIMVTFAEPISRFVQKHPTIKVLALCFLILIGVLLVAEGLGQHLDKGYIYFAMAFAVGIELLNMRLRPKPH